MVKKSIILLLISCITIKVFTQEVSAIYTTELQYNWHNKVNWSNLLRLGCHLPVTSQFNFDLALLSTYNTRTNAITPDWQTFSNIYSSNFVCAIAVAGLSYTVSNSVFFIGIRNVNEDFFVAPEMSLFTNSSCGIFPTISSNYPIANYPDAGLCLDYQFSWHTFNLRSSLYNGVGYNGWNKNNNPFRLRFKDDGIFLINELNYNTSFASLYGGASFYINRNHLLASEDDFIVTMSGEKHKKFSAVLWAYLEKPLLVTPCYTLNLLTQFSQNTDPYILCRRYMGLGATCILGNPDNSANRFGIFVSNAQFRCGNEVATELTYQYSYKSRISFQPTIHLIKNTSGFYKVLLVRLSFALDHSFKK